MKEKVFGQGTDIYALCKTEARGSDIYHISNSNPTPQISNLHPLLAILQLRFFCFPFLFIYYSDDPLASLLRFSPWKATIIRTPSHPSTALR